MDEAIRPNALKTAEVVNIHKSNSESIMYKYLPISLISLNQAKSLKGLFIIELIDFVKKLKNISETIEIGGIGK